MQAIVKMLIIFLFPLGLFSNWEEINEGLEGGIVRAIASDNENLYAGTDNGSVYFSDNEGDTWQLELVTENNSEIMEIHTTEDYVFVGSFGAGIYRLDKSNQEWKRTNTGLSSNLCASFFQSGDSLFAGTINKGLNLSTNFGESWEFVGHEKTYIKAITKYQNRIYVSKFGYGISYSDDGFETWIPVSNDDLPSNSIINFFEFNNVLYAASWGDGVFRFNNATNEWNQINNGLKHFYIWKIVEIEDVFYAATEGGVYKSTDYGESWKITNLIDKDVRNMITINKKIFVGTLFEGVFSSSDFGESWVSINNGISGVRVTDIFHNDNKLWIATYGIGIYQESSENFTKWNKAGLSDERIHTIASKENLMIVGTTNGLYFSSNMGNDWYKPSNQLDGNSIYSIKLKNDKIYAASWGKSVLVSEDNGTSWQQLNDDPEARYLWDMAIADNGNLVIASNKGIFISTDNGNKWEATYYDIFDSHDTRQIINKDGILYAACFREGIVYSENNGETWTALPEVMGDKNIKSVNAFDDFVIAGSTKRLYLFDKINNKWSDEINSNLGNKDINDILIHENYIYIATNNSGVHHKSIITSVKANKKNHFRIYPNPVQDELRIENYELGINQNIEIYDVLGDVVWKSNSVPSKMLHRSVSTTERIDISHLPCGVYFVRIGDKVEKFVKE